MFTNNKIDKCNYVNVWIDSECENSHLSGLNLHRLMNTLQYMGGCSASDNIKFATDNNLDSRDYFGSLEEAKIKASDVIYNFKEYIKAKPGFIMTSNLMRYANMGNNIIIAITIIKLKSNLITQSCTYPYFEE